MQDHDHVLGSTEEGQQALADQRRQLRLQQQAVIAGSLRKEAQLTRDGDVAFGIRRFLHAPTRAAGRTLGQLTETVAPAPAPPDGRLFEVCLTDEVEGLAQEPELPALGCVRAALRMVADGDARSITLCGLPDGHELLRVGGAMAIEGVVVEPLIRRGGGGFDLRVRSASPAEA